MTPAYVVAQLVSDRPRLSTMHVLPHQGLSVSPTTKKSRLMLLNATITETIKFERIDESYVSRVLRLTPLAPPTKGEIVLFDRSWYNRPLASGPCR